MIPAFVLIWPAIGRPWFAGLRASKPAGSRGRNMQPNGCAAG